jgi:hypothetical protein
MIFGNMVFDPEVVEQRLRTSLCGAFLYFLVNTAPLNGRPLRYPPTGQQFSAKLSTMSSVSGKHSYATLKE